NDNLYWELVRFNFLSMCRQLTLLNATWSAREVTWRFQYAKTSNAFCFFRGGDGAVHVEFRSDRARSRQQQQLSRQLRRLVRSEHQNGSVEKSLHAGHPRQGMGRRGGS